MAVEQGIVTQIEGNFAWVKTDTVQCEACASKGGCSNFGRQIKAFNSAGAEKGDTVIVNLQTTPLLKAVFLIYMLPIIMLLTGALTGHLAAPYINIDQSSAAIAAGLLFIAISVFIVKKKGNIMSKQDRYIPKITDVIKNRSK